jgi:hypothetical protein
VNSAEMNVDGRQLYEIVRGGVSGDGPSVFRSRVALQPAGGWEQPVLRAAVYSDGARTFNGGNGPGPVISTIRKVNGSEVMEVMVALIQSVEARGHRLAEALREVLTEAGVGVPLIELYRLHPAPAEWNDLLTDSFEASHHVADAAWREALDPAPEGKEADRSEWKAFWEARGRGLDPRKPITPAALLSAYPVSLLLGYDPRAAILSAREGRASRRRRGGAVASENGAEEAQPLARHQAQPWGRVWRSEIVAEIDGLYNRTYSLVRKRPAMLDTDIYQTQDGGWTLHPEEAKQETDKKTSKNKPVLYPSSKGEPGRPSAIGLDNVTPALRSVPDVWARSVTMTSYLSLAGLRKLFFGTDDYMGSPKRVDLDADIAGRALLAVLAIAATLRSEADLRIRSDCDLVPDYDVPDHDRVTREFVGPGGQQQVVIDDDAAADALRLAVGAVHAGADGQRLWAPAHIRLVADEQYARLVEPVGEGA